MNDSVFSKWTSLGGRIGRKEYWLYYMLPAGVLMSFNLGGLPLAGWASLWMFTIGNVKRVRDLKVSGALVLGLWGSMMAIAAVIAAGLFIFGLMNVMGNGGSNGEELMAAAGIVFLIPIGGLLLFAGFIPGVSDKQGSAVLGSDSTAYAPASAHPSKPLSKGAKKAVVAGVGILVLGFVGYGTWDFFTHREPALIRAIHSRQLEEVYAVLERGADANQRIIGSPSAPLGATALELALGRWSGVYTHEIAAALVEYGADPSGSPLVTASMFDDSILVELMLAHGANVNDPEIWNGQTGQTPLMAAIEACCNRPKGNAHIVSILLNNGADDPSALARAVLKGEVEIVDVFLEHGADVNAIYSFERTRQSGETYSWGGTPLLLAVSGLSAPVDMVSLLMERGADPRLQVGARIPPFPRVTVVSPLMFVEKTLQGGGDRYRTVLDLLRGGK